MAPPVSKAYTPNMTDSVSFKAYLKKDGQDVEVRRFGIDGGAITSYVYLRGKIQAMFPSVQNDNFVIFWQDADNDYITLSSDEELMVALTSGSSQPIKLYIHLKSNTAQGSNNQEMQHPGVVCDGCEGAVVGYRYKCVTCPDFDLCATCEASGRHSEHFMLRMPSPMNSSCHPKVFRKLFGRPHKFNRRHGWDRSFMHGESQGPNRCPFTQRENTPAAGVPDMFDFSALMEFINSLGVATTAGGAEATASSQAQATASSQTQATASSQAQPTPGSQAQPTPPQPEEPRQTTPNPNAYLNSIGQAIAAFLDPFDLPVKKKNKIYKIIKKHVYGSNCPKHDPLESKPRHELHGPKHVRLTHGLKHRLCHGPRDGYYYSLVGVHRPKNSHHTAPMHGHGPKHDLGIRYRVVRLGKRMDQGGCRALKVDNEPNIEHCNGVDVTFDVRSKTPGTQEPTGPSAQSSQPQNTPATQQQPAASPPSASPYNEAAPSTPAVVNPSVPMNSPAQSETVREASPIPSGVRRNSDDWTLLNRESPVRVEIDMDVEESRSKPHVIYPELPREAPSAPPRASGGVTDPELQRVQDAMEKINSMGFNFDPTLLRDLLRQEKGNIASVLELILSNPGRK